MQAFESSTNTKELLKSEPQSALSTALSDAVHWGQEHKEEIGLSAAALLLGGSAALAFARRESTSVSDRALIALTQNPSEKFIVRDAAELGGRIDVNPAFSGASAESKLPQLSLHDVHGSGLQSTEQAVARMQERFEADENEFGGRIAALNRNDMPAAKVNMDEMPWLHDPDFFKPNPSMGPILDHLIESFARAGIAMR